MLQRRSQWQPTCGSTRQSSGSWARLRTRTGPLGSAIDVVNRARTITALQALQLSPVAHTCAVHVLAGVCHGVFAVAFAAGQLHVPWSRYRVRDGPVLGAPGRSVAVSSNEGGTRHSNCDALRPASQRSCAALRRPDPATIAAQWEGPSGRRSIGRSPAASSRVQDSAAS